MNKFHEIPQSKHIMKATILNRAALCGLLLSSSAAFAAVGTMFTYQGRLTADGGPANGSYDFRFNLYAASSGGSPMATGITNSAVAVVNGLFTTPLDFGSVYNGTAYWLDIGVRTNGSGGDFVSFNTRQQLTPTPYAMFATSAGVANNIAPGSVTASNLAGNSVTALSIANGTVVRSLNGLTDAVSLSAGQNVSITPSGNTLQISATSGTGSWSLVGNNGTGSENFIGTTGPQPLQFRVFNQPAFRMEFSTAAGFPIPNIIGGASGNHVVPGMAGATIAGGGQEDAQYGNSVTANFGTVSGGYANTSGGRATVGGGSGNTSSGELAFVGGGGGNTASGGDSTVSGGAGNTSSGLAGTVGGGIANSSGDYGTVGGGLLNTASGVGAFIGGGGYDGFNSIGNVASGVASTVAGGLGNAATNQFATVAGGEYNVSSGGFATVGGGRYNVSSNNFATVAGGQFNNAGGPHSTVAGGYGNQAYGPDSATVGGGYLNVASNYAATVSGGQNNMAWGLHAVVGGGYFNKANRENAMVGGGSNNLASGLGCTVSGGLHNTASGRGALSFFESPATVGGGENNNASGNYSTIPGGVGNSADGFGSFAAGQNAHADHDGSFVWGDGTGWAGSAGPNRFEVRATGGFNFYAGPHPVTIDPSGTLNVPVLTIYGGSDLAEPFQMSVPETQKGAVVVIDEENPGKLKLSERAYDTRVAGIVSGAKGIKPGISLSQQGVMEGGQDIALSGRVYVLADASSGPIKPGDLLTTSDVPGHAMKVTNPARAQGAILGKAMSALSGARGMVLVLVTLQ